MDINGMTFLEFTRKYFPGRHAWDYVEDIGDGEPGHRCLFCGETIKGMTYAMGCEKTTRYPRPTGE